MSGVLSMLLGAHSGVFMLSGATITQAAIPAPSHAGVRIDSDGNVYSVTNAGSVQLSPATDWIRPAALAPGTHTVRATVNSGNLHGTSEPEDTDLDLTSDREFFVATSLVGTVTANITVEIKIGAIVLASGVYDLTATTF